MNNSISYHTSTSMEVEMFVKSVESKSERKGGGLLLLVLSISNYALVSLNLDFLIYQAGIIILVLTTSGK